MAKGDRRARKGAAEKTAAPVKGVSDLDAMGKDKRREVIGHSYGPSKKSQVLFFVIVAAVLVVTLGGYSLAISEFDQPADSYPDKAPWAQSANATTSPSAPCGEPGNPYPAADTSPCSEAFKKANAPFSVGSANTSSKTGSAVNEDVAQGSDSSKPESDSSAPGESGEADDYSFLDDPGN